MRALLQEALDAAGFRVKEATNGAEALSAFNAFGPDLVILDVLMPHMDGFEACEKLRGLPGGENVPIVMITGMDDVDSIRRAYDAGATDFASKPLNLLILCQRIRYMLRAKRTLEDLKRSQSRLARAQKIARLGSWEKDIPSGTLRWSREMYRLFDVPPETFTPTVASVEKRIHPEDRESIHRATDEAIQNVAPYNLDLRVLLANGGVRHVQEQAQVILDASGRPVRMEGTTQDITDRKRAEEQIRFLAYYDGLTSLPNRSLFMERLDRALESSRRNERRFGTLFFDLDHFKRINDTLGHRIGDRLLIEVAQRLRKCLRSSDTVARGDPLLTGQTVARLGGDEFTVLLTEILRGEDAARVARRILEAVGRPYRIDEHELHVGASIGISLYPDDGADMETLLKNADTAMYHAKEAGGGRYQFYSRSMNATALERLSLETSLRRAIERQELLLYLHPQMEVASGRIAGAEVLVHWRHPEIGLVSPESFMPLAEETGLVAMIGAWALESLGRLSPSAPDGADEPLRLSHNLSGREFWQPDLAEALNRLLKKTDLDPGRLVLEIPEDDLMRNPEEAARTIRQLRALGLRICIDRFGTGHSSLAYLSRLKVDALKIDRKLAADAGGDPGAAAILESILSLGRGLGVEIIVDGVDDPAQLDDLTKRGCVRVQGAVCGRPVPAEELDRLATDRTGPPLARGAA